MRIRFLSLLALLLAFGVVAQDEPAEPSADQNAEATSEPTGTAADRAPRPAPGRAADEEVFIPSEEIPADEEVTFPVDI